LQIDIGGADYNYLVAGFSAKERTLTDPAYWRWTYGTAYLRLPWPDVAARQGATLTLRLSAGPEERKVRAPAPPGTPTPAAERPLVAAPAQVKLSLGDLKLGEATLVPGEPFREVTVAVPPGAPTDPKTPGWLLLRINASTWSPAEAGVSYDERALGVELDSVTLAAPGTSSSGR
jgi:hypothetical protein